MNAILETETVNEQTRGVPIERRHKALHGVCKCEAACNHAFPSTCRTQHHFVRLDEGCGECQYAKTMVCYGECNTMQHSSNPFRSYLAHVEGVLYRVPEVDDEARGTRRNVREVPSKQGGR